MNTLTLVLPDKEGNLQLSCKQLLGTISIVENIRVPKINPNSLKRKDPVPVRTDFKRRHPIYGTGNIFCFTFTSIVILLLFVDYETSERTVIPKRIAELEKNTPKEKRTGKKKKHKS